MLQALIKWPGGMKEMQLLNWTVIVTICYCQCVRSDRNTIIFVGEAALSARILLYFIPYLKCIRSPHFLQGAQGSIHSSPLSLEWEPPHPSTKPFSPESSWGPSLWLPCTLQSSDNCGEPAFRSLRLQAGERSGFSFGITARCQWKTYQSKGSKNNWGDTRNVTWTLGLPWMTWNDPRSK